MGILGTGASASSDIVLLLYVFALTPGMLIGLYFARRKMFVPHHKFVMTTIVIVNWVLILALMAGSYSAGVLPGLGSSLGDIRVLLPTLHLITGAIAQLLGTYLVLLMWTENTALEKLVVVRIKRIKTPMRLTLALWLVTIALGVAIYFVWYTPSTATASDTPPSATEEAPSATEEAPAESDSTDPAATEQAPADAPADADSGPSATEEAPAESDAAEPAATEEASGG